MLFDSFVCSLRNLGRKRFRSFLTIASIAIGVASVVLIGSIGEIGKQTISDELNSLGLGSLTVSADQKFTRQKMDQRDLELIRNLPTVKSATPVVVDFSSIRMRGLVANAMLWGVDCEGDQLISLKPQHGRLLNEADIAGASDVCVIDANVAQMFYKRDNIVGKYLDWRKLCAPRNHRRCSLRRKYLADNGGGCDPFLCICALYYHSKIYRRSSL